MRDTHPRHHTLDLLCFPPYVSVRATIFLAIVAAKASHLVVEILVAQVCRSRIIQGDLASRASAISARERGVSLAFWNSSILTANGQNSKSVQKIVATYA